MAHRQNSDIAAQIRFKEALLDCVQHLRNDSKNRSDMGWLTSIATVGAGTVMAVLSGKKAHQYNQIIRELERDIIMLKVEERLMQDRPD